MTDITFWKMAEKKTIDPQLFSVHAEKLAQELAEVNQRSRQMNKRTQIRKFYDEVVRLDMAAKTRDWDDVQPLIHMLVAKVAYARGRNLVSDDFVGFIRSAVGQVSQKDDLAVFASFFEAFMGFYRLHGPSN
jgi:CRISPR-associated protein Csm2